MPPITLFVALADPTRCRIIEILRDGPQPVHVLAASFDISRPAISRHLRVLKQARLIGEKKTGRENRYALHAGKLKPVRTWLAAFETAEKPGDVVSPKPAPTPVPDAHESITVAKARRAAPVSQMGFDF